MAVEPNNTISTATASGVSSGGTRSTTVSSNLNPASDVDVFQLEANQGDTITFNIAANQLSGGLGDSILRVFDINGNQLAVNDDSQAPGEIFSLDSYIEVTANATGQFFVGVSSFSNFNYDVINGGGDGSGGTTGNYQLGISVFNTINGNSSANNLSGTAQNDFIRGLGSNDTLIGGNQNDNLGGDTGNDSLNGGNGNDTLLGGDGFDQLVGGSGNDVLQGQNGIDSIRGNAGADTFVLDSDFSTSNSVGDSVFDFQDGVDRILLANGSSFASVELEQLGGNTGTAISLFGETIGTLVGIQASSITEADFVNG
jgi:Ca2+-binding RTX toxin-like protein